MSPQNACQCNEQLLSELIQVIKRLSSNNYQKPATTDGRQTIGAHVRHIIEFYQCFLSGLDSRSINYDNRNRDPECERNVSSAVDALLIIKERLVKLTKNTSNEINLTLNACTDTNGSVSTAETSVVRELLFLQCHTTHHMAIINLLLQQPGLLPPKNFGVATSTLIYQKQQEASSES
ncbi:DinB family protein [Endozoicomonas sp. SESOKO1]|uniref:DinB family protein n=1 Tax=Endozoicomonas sp. SESOKO1 TaxID=2828742 RepID=UPI0021481AE8|nr:DinB family protein [Endozoicomonas sp. SESOKO1]